MVEASKNDQNRLEDFFAAPDALDKLARIAYQTSPEDQDYIAEHINEMLYRPGDYTVLLDRISEYMDAEETLPEVRSYVLANADIDGIKAEETTDKFQNMVLKLRAMAEEGEDGASVAKAVMFYAVGLAQYEWKDNKRGGVPYDEDVDGPIRFSTGSHEPG
tara:strand:- start:7797 stop:8279 length:483 start_codon:yes stop_codon:yes gene_type:complete